jgi:hypothetical protein
VCLILGPAARHLLATAHVFQAHGNISRVRSEIGLHRSDNPVSRRVYRVCRFAMLPTLILAITKHRLTCT